MSNQNYADDLAAAIKLIKDDATYPTANQVLEYYVWNQSESADISALVLKEQGADFPAQDLGLNGPI